jgi:hypothetical protein
MNYGNAMLSMRACDSNDILAGAAVIRTAEIDQSIHEFFADRRAANLHVHYAGPGCFACRVDRNHFTLPEQDPNSRVCHFLS